MQLSDKGQGLIKSFERYRPTAYLPTRHDKWTCGWGHTGHDVTQTTTCSYAQAQAWFMSDTATAVHAVNTFVKVKLTQNQFDALVSLAFNIGVAAFEESTLLRKLNDGDYGGAAAEFLKWEYQAHVKLAGLETRREAEKALFLTP